MVYGIEEARRQEADAFFLGVLGISGHSVGALLSLRVTIDRSCQNGTQHMASIWRLRGAVLTFWGGFGVSCVWCMFSGASQWKAFFILSGCGVEILYPKAGGGGGKNKKTPPVLTHYKPNICSTKAPTAVSIKLTDGQLFFIPLLCPQFIRLVAVWAQDFFAFLTSGQGPLFVCFGVVFKVQSLFRDISRPCTRSYFLDPPRHGPQTKKNFPPAEGGGCTCFPSAMSPWIYVFFLNSGTVASRIYVILPGLG